jgi:hypothetical protein
VATDFPDTSLILSRSCADVAVASRSCHAKRVASSSDSLACSVLNHELRVTSFGVAAMDRPRAR